MSTEGLQKREEGGDLGGTMRLGAYDAELAGNSVAAGIYGSTKISERHRHRWEVNTAYRDRLEKGGLVFSGMSPDGMLPEIVERPDHPWFIGVQFHPELKSKPFDPHPLFAGFIEAAVKQAGLIVRIRNRGYGSLRLAGCRAPTASFLSIEDWAEITRRAVQVNFVKGKELLVRATRHDADLTEGTACRADPSAGARSCWLTPNPARCWARSLLDGGERTASVTRRARGARCNWAAMRSGFCRDHRFAGR